MRTVAATRGIERTTADERRALVEVADSLGIEPDWLAAVISFESGWDPKAKNKFSGATGLIQFMPATASGYGYTIAQIAAMPIEGQLRGPVYQYLATKGKMRNLEDTYLAVFFPKAMGRPDSFVVGVKDGLSGVGESSDPKERKFQAKVYTQNAALDTNKDGVIRRSDIVGVIRSVARAAEGKPRLLVPDAPVLQRPWIFFALFATSGAALVWAVSRHTSYGKQAVRKYVPALA